MEKSLELPYVTLKEMIEVSEQDLNEFLSNKPINTMSNTVPTALFRRIISIAKKIFVNTENGLTNGIELDYRGLFETFLGLEYIFREIENSPKIVEKRLKYYAVNHHYMLLKTAKDALKSKDFAVFSKKEMEGFKSEQESILKSPELHSCLIEYEKAKKKNRNLPPHWFSVESGYTSFNKLARYIGEGIEKGELMAEIYSILSKESHGQTCLRDVKDMGETFEMKTPLNVSLENAISINLNILNLTRVMLFRSLEIFNTYVFKDNKEKHEKFKREYSKVCMYLDQFEK